MTGLNLPRKCGVMLLPDCTLFPHGGLPLYIFEPRYRQMLADALEGECVFAVAKFDEGGDGGKGRVAKVGTAGLVRASKLGDDGTSQLLLHGVIRVEFKEWLEGVGYPCAAIEAMTCVPLEEGKDEAAMRMLRGAVEDGISVLPTKVRIHVLTLLDQADDAGLLTDLVAQQFVNDPGLRQELLETTDVGTRVRLLCEFFDQVRSGEDGEWD